MSVETSSPCLTKAHKCISLVLKDPVRAKRSAQEQLAEAIETRDFAAASVAQRAVGLANRELGDIPSALDHMRSSIKTAESHGFTDLAVCSRIEEVWLLAYRGEGAEALRKIEVLERTVRGANRARLDMAHAHVKWLMGRLEEAVALNSRAVATFRGQGDRLWEAMCLNNRGLVHVERGNLSKAHADLCSAEKIYRELGNDLAIADLEWNRGLLEARRGNIPAALRLYDRADRQYRHQRIPKPHLLLDRCQLYISARLLPEAVEAATRAVEELSRAGRRLETADALLMLSDSLLLQGDAARAASIGERAMEAFARQQRPGWLALAKYSTLKARWMAGRIDSSTLTLARQAVDELSVVGWDAPAVDARVLAARIALDLGQTASAGRDLKVAGRATRRRPVDVRISAWHATALLRLSDGNRRGAYSALRTGMRILDEHRASLEATELRTQASGHGRDLAQLGLRMASTEGNPRKVLAWAERWRARALQARAALPPSDPALVNDYAELRRIAAELAESALEGHFQPDLARRQVELEESIRRQLWQSNEGYRAESHRELEIKGLIDSLGGRALVEFVEVDGQLWVVVVSGRRVFQLSIGNADEIRREVVSLRFATRRLATAEGPVWDAARYSCARTVERLRHLLVEPLATLIEDRPLVVVPTEPLHALPWARLFGHEARPVSVLPSARYWLSPSDPISRGRAGNVLLVAGPGLPGAEQEIAELASAYPQARVLTGALATSANVLDGLEGADLAHLATHTRFRSDNPLFSSLQLRDGPLMVYDLERLNRVPGTVVLASCESGMSGVAPGDELMGLASCLLSLGTGCLIVSVAPVQDRSTKNFMSEFHAQFLETPDPAVALARAQSNLRHLQSENLGAGDDFICIWGGAFPPSQLQSW